MSSSLVADHSQPDALSLLHGDELCILLVEDNVDHAFLTRRELQSALSCEIKVAGSGQEALEALAEHIASEDSAFDVILLDNGLPDMSGLDLLSVLHERGENAPMILLTGQGSETIAVEALRRGAFDYIVKVGDYLKVLPEVITQVIERNLIRRRNDHLEAEHVRFARLAAIGEVAAGIAHEVRNPMMVISGMGTLIRDNLDSLPPEEIRNCARAIVENCRHLNTVVEEILSNSQTPQESQPLLLADVLDETLSFMRFDSSFRQHMQTETDFGCRGLVLGSRDQLKQVFINLFRNAAQAVQLSGQREGRLGVTLQKQDGEVVVQIRDNGEGIAPEVLPRIFESGFSTKKNRGNEVNGFGLGLGICRRIIEQHEGRLWAEPTEPGQGALFCLTLPVLDSDNHAAGADGHSDG